MKLSCPYCTEKITYDLNLAGKTIKCSYCQKDILMSPFNKLAPEYQQEYREEQEKIRKKQEAELKGLEEQRRRELERQEAEKQRQIQRDLDLARQQKQHAQQQMMQQVWNGKVTEAKQRIPEEELIETNIFGIVITQSYPILKLIATVYRILGMAFLISGLIIFFVALYTAIVSEVGVFVSWILHFPKKCPILPVSNLG